MGLILVDSSVWIDVLGKRITPQTSAVRRLSANKNRLAVGDLVLTEVLQGARTDHQFAGARMFLAQFASIAIMDDNVAVAAARHYRHLRTLGITVRKTIDTLIATRCILDRIPLLYSDRDFDAFVQHLGLRSALDIPGVS